MSGEAWLYLFAVLINAVNLFLQVFFTIMYSDLEWYVVTASRLACTGAARDASHRSYPKPQRHANPSHPAAVTTSTPSTSATA